MEKFLKIGEKVSLTAIKLCSIALTALCFYHGEAVFGCMFGIGAIIAFRCK